MTMRKATVKPNRREKMMTREMTKILTTSFPLPRVRKMEVLNTTLRMRITASRTTSVCLPKFTSVYLSTKRLELSGFTTCTRRK